MRNSIKAGMNCHKIQEIEHTHGLSFSLASEVKLAERTIKQEGERSTKLFLPNTPNLERHILKIVKKFFSSNTTPNSRCDLTKA